jgi:monovalent cation/hydrogen antiporter
MDSLQAVQTVFLLLLVIVAGFAVMARRIKVAYPIVLVIGGLAISFVPHIPRIRLEPELIFLIILPPLLYSSAWTMSWREFRHNLVTIMLLAVGLVAFTVWGVAAFSDRFITALDWKSGFLLGAVVSTTDAIAATSIAKTLGLPRSVVDILEGESLLNDATGLLALEFGLGMLLRDQTPTVGGGLWRLAYLIVVGVIVGLLTGMLANWFEKFVEDGPIELMLSLVVPYVAYLAGEHLHASGVIAVVVCGLYMGRKSTTFFSPSARIQVEGAWEALTFILNGIVFVLIGLQLPYVLAGIRGMSWQTLALYGALFSVVLIVLRLVWMFPAAKIAYLIQKRIPGHTEEAPSARGVFVIGWTGMRGVLALAAAFSLPETLGNGQPFVARNLIVFLAFCVILVTLVLQGLTLPALIRALGLARKDVGMEPEECSARRVVLQEAIAFLEGEKQADGERFEHAYDDLLHRYQHRLAAVGGGSKEDGLDAGTYGRLRAAAAGAIRTERRAMIRLRSEGVIGDDVLRTLQKELDLAESRYAGDERQ